jgi:hypothetical protein
MIVGSAIMAGGMFWLSRITACRSRSRRTAWTCSRSAGSPRIANHQNQVTAVHRDSHYRRRVRFAPRR